MKKVFLSTSFSGKTDVDGRVDAEFRTFVEQILRALRKANLEIFCAVEDEGWLIADGVPPEVGVKKDLERLEVADVLLALAIRRRPV